MHAAVFFDKDGILNEVVMRGDDVSSPRVLEEFRLIDGASELVAAACEAGFRCILATNQPDVQRGLMTAETLHEILARVGELGLDDVEVSLDGTLSDRRAKPNPGMLLDAAAKHDLELSRSFMVGDTERDVEAGRRAGAKTVLLRTSYNEAAHGSADWEFDSLVEIAEFLRTTARALAFEDSQSKPRQSLSVFNKFVAIDRVNGILGDIFSFITEPLIPLADREKKLLVSPSASQILCSNNKSKYFFTTASQVARSSEGYGYFLDRHPEVKKVALVYFQDPGWGYQYRDAWSKLLSERGLKVSGEFETGDFAPDFKTPLAKLLRDKPDAFFVAQDPTTFIPASKQMGFDGKIVFANNILEVPASGAEVKILEGVYFVDTLASAAFEKRFVDRFHQAPLLEPYNGYEALRTLITAIAQQPDSPELAVPKIKYEGVSGMIDFSESCAGNKARWHLKQFKDGKISLIE